MQYFLAEFVFLAWCEPREHRGPDTVAIANGKL
jgi:hypothetical protein